MAKAISFIFLFFIYVAFLFIPIVPIIYGGVGFVAFGIMGSSFCLSEDDSYKVYAILALLSLVTSGLSYLVQFVLFDYVNINH